MDFRVDAKAVCREEWSSGLCCCLQGFEMNPEEWIPYSNVKDNVELDIWESKLGGDAQ